MSTDLDTSPPASGRDVWSELALAWNSRDAVGVATGFAPDGRLAFFDGNLFNGRAAIETFYRDTFAAMPRDWVHSNPIVDGSGTIAKGSFVIAGENGQKTMIHLQYELTLAPDGFITDLTLTKS